MCMSTAKASPAISSTSVPKPAPFSSTNRGSRRIRRTSSARSAPRSIASRTTWRAPTTPVSTRTPTVRRRSGKTCLPCTRSPTRPGTCTESRTRRRPSATRCSRQRGKRSSSARHPLRHRRPRTTSTPASIRTCRTSTAKRLVGTAGRSICGPPIQTGLRRVLACNERRRYAGDLAGGDLLGDLQNLLHVGLRHFRADLAETDPVVRQPEDGVRPARELVVEHLLDRRVDRDVDALQRARQHLLAEIRLVCVDAYPPHVPFLRGIEHTEPAATGDLEDDVRAGGDLIQCGRFALGLVDPVL